MIQKDKPFWYLDTHSGAGIYDLAGAEAQKTNEAHHGIHVMLRESEEKLPEALHLYLRLVKRLQAKHPHHYPGSPWFAQQILRPQDKLRLFELHPKDHQHLEKHFRQDRRCRIEKADGHHGLKALLPPPPKRALILIDPPYEQEKEYNEVIKSITESLKRFATGTYIVWYPLIQRASTQGRNKSGSAENMLKQLKRAHSDWLNVQFCPDTRIQGMFGSGLFIINPPWLLAEQLQNGLTALAHYLGQDTHSRISIESNN
ncbi:MAG: 23S rRNA (adenine(2030)-N(6))-methyltransferase RlmJ [Pseudomonadales bacterium]|nr:23S rRNA (adenine(2030)-N(6))-methyltransferase RlmJ [Pseudomonadales bacterium]